MYGMDSLQFFSLCPAVSYVLFSSPYSLLDVSVHTFVAYLSGFSFSAFVEYKFIDESSDLCKITIPSSSCNKELRITCK